MLDAVLLEWEGVLADTADARRAALVSALADEGIPADVTWYAVHGDGLDVRSAAVELLERAGRADPTLTDLVVLRTTRAFAERLGKGVSLLPGARAFVEHMHLGARVGVVTSATRSETEFVLRLAGLDAFISTVVSADDRLDDCAARYERALDALSRLRNVQRGRVVAMARSSPALRGARAAGVRAVAVDAPAHIAVDADGVVDAIAGLTAIDLARIAGVRAAEPQC